MSTADECGATATAPTILPDVLAHGLDIVFCGTAAGAVSAARGAYYAGPGNAFWPTLFAVGLIPVALPPTQYARLPGWKLGLTDLAKHVAGADSVLHKRHFGVERLRSIIGHYQPRIVAFTGKRAASEFLGRAAVYGLLAEAIGVTRLFVLPSPSGAARRHWNADHWRNLVHLRATLP